MGLGHFWTYEQATRCASAIQQYKQVKSVERRLRAERVTYFRTQERKCEDYNMDRETAAATPYPPILADGIRSMALSDYAGFVFKRLFLLSHKAPSCLRLDGRVVGPNLKSSRSRET